ncbi:MAG: hypothetical protein KF780_12355 [Sphingomonas sp.]|nr:hypothetical protein [Sphingomonas sp.]
MNAAPPRELDMTVILRLARVFETSAVQAADDVGDECPASAMLLAYSNFVTRRWGAGCLREKLLDLIAEIDGTGGQPAQ